MSYERINEREHCEKCGGDIDNGCAKQSGDLTVCDVCERSLRPVPANENIMREYRGKVEINGEKFNVVSDGTFNGVIHYGIFGQSDGARGPVNVIGWIPACLCNIP